MLTSGACQMPAPLQSLSQCGQWLLLCECLWRSDELLKRLRKAYVPCFIMAKTLRDPSRLGVNKGTVRPGRSQGCVHIAWMSNAPCSLLPALVTPTLLSALHTSLQWLPSISGWCRRCWTPGFSQQNTPQVPFSMLLQQGGFPDYRCTPAHLLMGRPHRQ